MRNASFQTLFKSTALANVFATLTNSCACRVFCNVSKSLRLPREKRFELPNTSRDRQFLTIWICKSRSRNEALKLQKRAFLRDFLQKSSFEAQERNFSARLPSEMKLSSSKTKLFRETSFKNQALRLKNEAFLRDFLFKNEAFKLKNETFSRDFLQKPNFEAQERSFSTRLPSKMN